MQHPEIDYHRLTAPSAARPLSTREWVSVALRENGGDRGKAMMWIHEIYGENPTPEALHGLAKILTFLAEEDL